MTPSAMSKPSTTHPANTTIKFVIYELVCNNWVIILTRTFFESITPDTDGFDTNLLAALAVKNILPVYMYIILMSDISFGEIQEKLYLSKE